MICSQTLSLVEWRNRRRAPSAGEGAQRGLRKSLGARSAGSVRMAVRFDPTGWDLSGFWGPPVQMAVRSDPKGGDLSGFWGPPTSTIDWCEHNYVVSTHVAEFFNTFSSLSLVSRNRIITIRP